ncbi:hypothetical protein [Bradyrhizobium sp. Ash2021]|uniref:hypothetical protein n=1 Tax=Bradyrhizobium sp. Ash2021 TaxID=2954771 RepID=UPI002814C544|nr:hypothetical protein [Bradyrhizobium sp. Ash2021]WMT72078.1 hypothetical protein NL528_28980 [Bradyrhizobium sp. Ash2021]
MSYERMGGCDRAPIVAVGHMQMFQAAADMVATAVKTKPHRHAWHPAVDFAAYQKAGDFVLKDCLANKRTHDELIIYLERDPHRFLEGVLIASWVVEASDTTSISAMNIPMGG